MPPCDFSTVNSLISSTIIDPDSIAIIEIGSPGSFIPDEPVFHCFHMNGGPLNQKAGMFILLVDDNDVVKDAVVVNMTASEISSQFTNVSVDSIEGWSGDAIMTDGSQYINVQRINANIDTDSKDDWTYGHTYWQ